MDVKKIRKNLKKEISKFQKIKKDLQKSFSEQKIPNNDLEKVVEKDHVEDKYSKKREFTNEELQKLKNTKKSMHNEFKKSIMSEISGEEDRQKEFKPITNALKKVESAVKEGQEKIDNDIKALVPRVPVLSPLLLQPPTRTQTPTLETSKYVNLGPIATKYISRANDKTFGIYYDQAVDKWKIGKSIVKFDNDDIILNEKRIVGTPGLWRLLTYSAPPGESLCTKDDFNSYYKILIETESIYQNNNKSTGKPKSSSGDKYKSLIKPLWEHITKKQGSGLKKYSETPVEYKYIENLNELLKRLYFIASEEKAGNNNFYNEKQGILHFFTRELEKLLDSQNGTEILISFVSRLPKKVVGSGLINDFINKLPFEMHWPDYNYLGPGTKLDKRLERGDQPINKLDEAAQEHDIFYKNHKDTKTRHKADEVLEYKAWDRVLDPNANLGEKTAAWVTTNAMKLKRHLGMGLK